MKNLIFGFIMRILIDHGPKFTNAVYISDRLYKVEPIIPAKISSIPIRYKVEPGNMGSSEIITVYFCKMTGLHLNTS